MEFEVKPPHAHDFRGPGSFSEGTLRRIRLAVVEAPSLSKGPALRGTPAAFAAGYATTQAMTDGATYGPAPSYRDSDGVWRGLTKGKNKTLGGRLSRACLVPCFDYAFEPNCGKRPIEAKG